jgi:hypothetical protein
LNGGNDLKLQALLNVLKVGQKDSLNEDLIENVHKQEIQHVLGLQFFRDEVFLEEVALEGVFEDLVVDQLLEKEFRVAMKLGCSKKIGVGHFPG